MATRTRVEEFPYKTYLNVLHGPLELIDVQKLAAACTDKWYNQTLCKVNDSVVRMAVVQGEYHWHEHKDIDEFFFVLDGRFLIDLEDRVIDLAPRQALIAPPSMSRSGTGLSAADGVRLGGWMNSAKFQVAIQFRNYKAAVLANA